MTLTIMHDRLTTIPDEKGVGKAVFFPLGVPAMPVTFAVLIGDGTQTIDVKGVEVGKMTLPSGGEVAIYGRPSPLSVKMTEAVRRARANLADSVTRTGSPRSLGMGFERLANGGIWLCDPGAIHPARFSRQVADPPRIVFGSSEG